MLSQIFLSCVVSGFPLLLYLTDNFENVMKTDKQKRNELNSKKVVSDGVCQCEFDSVPIAVIYLMLV